MEAIYENKIGKLIRKEFDTRMCTAVMDYIMEKGVENLKLVTEEQILTAKGNALMTDEFVQALVRVSVHISQQFCILDILDFAQKHCCFGTRMSMVNIYREDVVEDDTWEQLCEQADADPEEVDEIEVYGFIEARLINEVM